MRESAERTLCSTKELACPISGASYSPQHGKTPGKYQPKDLRIQKPPWLGIPPFRLVPWNLGTLDPRDFRAQDNYSVIVLREKRERTPEAR